MTKNEYSLIHLMLYENEFREAVDQVLAEIENAQEKNAGVLKIREESEVRVHLTSPDVEIEDGEETRIWYGEYLDFAFSVMVDRKSVV